jgi:hypothetical protein
MSEDVQPELRRLDGNADHNDALDTLFSRPGRKLRIFDRQLGSGYFGVHREQLLRGFLLASRSNRIQIVLDDAANLQRDCPRLMLLLRQFAYAININETEPQAKGVYDPFAVMDERDYVHRFHYDDSRGLLGLNDPQGAHELVQRFEEIWEASAPAISATTLGL